jgi:hypothetical protein
LPGHLDFLEDAHAFDFVFPARQGDFQIEPAEIVVAAGMKLVAELIDGEFHDAIFLAGDAERFAEAIEHEEPADRRKQRGTQEAVISAGVASDDGPAGEPADAVGDEPFLLEMRLELAVGFDGIQGHKLGQFVSGGS